MNLFAAHSPEDLPAVATALIELAGDRKVWLFEGEMGAGKTTLIKVLCKQLGVEAEMSSPTFSIVNEYRRENGQKIFHFDLYRLKQSRELADIGFDDYVYSGHYCLIEWPHQVEYDYENAFSIAIKTNGEQREISAQ